MSYAAVSYCDSITCSYSACGLHGVGLVRSAEYCYEVWDENRDGPRNSSSMSELRIENNVCIDSGGGWSHAQRPDPTGRHICMFSNTAMVSNVTILNNIFWQSVPYDAAWWMDEPWGYPNSSLPPSPCRLPNGCGWGHSIREDSNVFYQAHAGLGSLIILGARWNKLHKVYSYSAANFSLYQQETGNGQHSLITDPLLLGLDRSLGKQPSNATDVTPSADSPVIGRGQSVMWRQDFYGRQIPRDAPPDIGAVEHFRVLSSAHSSTDGS